MSPPRAETTDREGLHLVSEDQCLTRSFLRRRPERLESAQPTRPQLVASSTVSERACPTGIATGPMRTAGRRVGQLKRRASVPLTGHAGVSPGTARPLDGRWWIATGTGDRRNPPALAQVQRGRITDRRCI